MNSDRALELARIAFPNDEKLRIAYMLGCDRGYQECEEEKFDKLKELCDKCYTIGFPALKPNEPKKKLASIVSMAGVFMAAYEKFKKEYEDRD